MPCWGGVTTDDACFYIWHATSTQPEFRQALASCNLDIHQTLIWVKPRFTLTRADYQHTYEPCFYGWKKGQKHYTNNLLRSFDDIIRLGFDDFTELMDIWYEKRDDLMNYNHPTQKPVKLAERAIRKSSETGDIVVDIFAGSGSTMAACEQMDRSAYMMELDPKYCDVIIKRFEQLTGQKAEKVKQ